MTQNINILHSISVLIMLTSAQIIYENNACRKMRELYQATILQMCFCCCCCCSLNKQKQKLYDNTFLGKSVAIERQKGSCSDYIGH